MNEYRSQTFGRPLRLYDEDLAKATKLHQRACERKPRGRVVFISGQPKSGRTDFLLSIGHHLISQQPKPTIIAGQFSENRYHPNERDFTSPMMAAIGESMALVAKFLPDAPTAAVDLIGQMLQAGGANKELRDVIYNARPDWPETLKELLRRAVKEKPIVYLVDDLDECQDSWLADLLLEMATEIDRELALLVFVTVEGPTELPEYKESEPRLLTSARGLIESGVGEWWHVRPLSREETVAFIGNAAPGIAAHLHGVTGGYPPRVLQLWRDWQHRGVVHFADDDDCWHWNPEKQPSLNLVKDVIHDRLRNIFGRTDDKAIELAKRMLAVAALEGERFTAEAVALAINQDRDELLDFIDDHLVRSDDQPDGLLAEDGYLELPGQAEERRVLWQYRFAEDLFWLAFQRYGFTEQELLNESARMIQALQAVYAEAKRTIAGTLARLSRNCKNEDAATHYQKIWDYGQRREGMREKALRVVSLNKEDWNYWQLQLTVNLLLEAAKLMLGYCAVEETLLVLEEASLLALRIGSKLDQAQAGYLRGLVWDTAGDPQYSCVCLEFALSIYKEIGQRNGEAACLCGLGGVLTEMGKYEEARRNCEKALLIYRKINHQDGEANCLYKLGTVARFTSDYEKARSFLNEALTSFREVNSRDGEVGCLHELGEVALLTDNYAEAQRAFDEGRIISREICSQTSEAMCLRGLGRVAHLVGDYEEARQFFNEALTSFRAIGEGEGEADCLCGLGRIAFVKADYQEARNFFEEALTFYCKTRNEDGKGSCLCMLGSVARFAADYQEARKLLNEALTIFREISCRNKEAFCLNELGAVALLTADYEEAGRVFTEGLAIYCDIGSHDGEAHCLQGLGEMLRLTGKIEAARAQYETALTIFQKIGSQAGEATCLRVLGEINKTMES